MTVLARIAHKLANDDTRSISYQDVFGRGLDWSEWGVANTAADVAVTQQSSLGLAAVWACVRVYCDAIGSLPVGTYRPDGDYRRPMPTPGWLNIPNPETTRYELFEQLMMSLLLGGNAYLLVRWKGTQPESVWPLDPCQVAPYRDSDGTVAFRVTDSMSGAQVEIRNQPALPEIVHIRAHTAPGRLEGMSPIETVRQAIGLGLVAEEFGARWFGQGSTPSVAISLPESMGNPTQQQVETFKAAWESHHTGRDKHHRPAVLPGGAKLEQLSIPPEHAQFIETRKFQTSEIARIFRVPAHLIGDLERATFSNIEHQGIEFVEHSLRPWLVRLEQSLQVLIPAGRYLRFNVDGLLRGDVKSRYEAHAMGRMWGWVSANDVRALEDQSPIAGGDIYLQPVNMVPAGTEVIPPPEPAPVADPVSEAPDE